MRLLSIKSKYFDKNREYVSLLLNDFLYNDFQVFQLKKYGQNLYQKFISNQNFGETNIIKIITDICVGLNFLKKNNIIHGDLKPENILFIDNDKFDVVICDFNLSLNYNQLVFDKEYIVQSIWYRAPEILFNLEFDYSRDIWSLACIVYEIIYRSPLFYCSKEKELYKAFSIILGDPPKSIKSANIKTRKYFNLNFEPVIHTTYTENEYMFVKKSKIKAILNDTLRTIIDKTLFWDYRRRIKLEDILYILGKN